MKNETDINAINYCVIIPTYNNDKTLAQVISATLQYTTNIIVVNDGSNDNTMNILEGFKTQIEIIAYPDNQGKGNALKKGFKRAEELGYEYAITIDADGQHLAEDIPRFLEKVQPGQVVLIIGDRDMAAANVPNKSVFGKKFSNFWVKLETNQDLRDTQSGYRLYTVAEINQFRFFTGRYDFEIESLVRWAWRGFPVEIVPVDVYYPSPAERVSHFNGFKDNLRISLLNSILVIVAIIYVIPRRWWRSLNKGMKKLFSQISK